MKLEDDEVDKSDELLQCPGSSKQRDKEDGNVQQNSQVKKLNSQVLKVRC